MTGLMESLTEMEPAVSIRMPQPVRRWRQWAGAGAAIAAGIAIAAMLIPKEFGAGCCARAGDGDCRGAAGAGSRA